MKKLIYTLIAFPGALLAQPTIPLGDIPSPGEVMGFSDITDEPVINSGANQTWIIGGTVNYSDHYAFLATSLAPGSSNFPTAAIAVTDDSEWSYAFFSATGGELNHLGVYDEPNADVFAFTDPWTYMKYPCTMGTQWTDTYAWQGEPAETISYIADGYGTLIGPGGSLNNVLKVRSTQIYFDTIISGIHYESVDVTDRFWRPGEAFHVAVISTSQERENGVVVDELNFGVELKTSLAVGMEESYTDAIGVQAAPNPATDRLTLTFGAQGIVRIEVLDALGQVMGTPVQRTVSPGVSTEALNVQGWPAGQYCARITMANGDQGSVRFVVQ